MNLLVGVGWGGCVVVGFAVVGFAVVNAVRGNTMKSNNKISAVVKNLKLSSIVSEFRAVASNRQTEVLAWVIYLFFRFCCL